MKSRYWLHSEAWVEDYLKRWYKHVIDQPHEYKVVKKFVKDINICFIQKDEVFDDWRVLIFLKLVKKGRKHEAIL